MAATTASLVASAVLAPTEPAASMLPSTAETAILPRSPPVSAVAVMAPLVAFLVAARASPPIPATLLMAVLTVALVRLAVDVPKSVAVEIAPATMSTTCPMPIVAIVSASLRVATIWSFRLVRRVDKTSLAPLRLEIIEFLVV